MWKMSAKNRDLICFWITLRPMKFSVVMKWSVEEMFSRSVNPLLWLALLTLRTLVFRLWANPDAFFSSESNGCKSPSFRSRSKSDAISSLVSSKNSSWKLFNPLRYKKCLASIFCTYCETVSYFEKEFSSLSCLIDELQCKLMSTIKKDFSRSTSFSYLITYRSFRSASRH